MDVTHQQQYLLVAGLHETVSRGLEYLLAASGGDQALDLSVWESGGQSLGDRLPRRWYNAEFRAGVLDGVR
ncbi:hypothetical protein [Streptomyces cyaneofuscatus]|uniref:hypothetical protein n=1 Tax=Streptomyces cyaneofuscatus TaxID=66883 RepID=UPI00365D45CE